MTVESLKLLNRVNCLACGSLTLGPSTFNSKGSCRGDWDPCIKYLMLDAWHVPKMSFTVQGTWQWHASIYHVTHNNKWTGSSCTEKLAF